MAYHISDHLKFRDYAQQYAMCPKSTRPIIIRDQILNGRVEDQLKQNAYRGIPMKRYLPSGSSYSGVMIDKSDLDVMLILKSRNQMYADPIVGAPGFYHIYGSNRQLIPGGDVRKELFSRLRSLIPPSFKVGLEQHGPAIQLNVNDEIEIDLVPAFEINGEHYVPKQHRAWPDAFRFSYSQYENKRLRELDDNYKVVLRVCKTVILHDDRYSSYDCLKAFLAEVEDYPHPRDWNEFTHHHRFNAIMRRMANA